MAHKCLYVFVAVIALSSSALAQSVTPRVEVFGGYSLGRSEGENVHGFNTDVAVSVTSWLGIVGDFAGHYRSLRGGFVGGEALPSNAKVNLSDYTFAFGPRLSSRAWNTVTPFAHVLFGADHLKFQTRNSDSGPVANLSQTFNGFQMFAGGGVDIAIGSRAAFRAKAEFDRTSIDGETGNGARIGLGVVVRLGSR